MSKLQFRARALDASKPMPIYMAEELPDLTDYSAINRAVPQMPSGMEKEEECEHHLQRAICTGLIIPTPEVASMADADAYDKIYPANYKQPRQLIHMQPFTMEQEIPDYDMDSEDEAWVGEQARRLDLTPLKFESMMDRLEKSSGQTVVTLHDAKALLKEDDDLIIAIFDYWLNKRLKTQHPLILAVKTEHRLGSAANNPYLAFRRRTEKMQTRKNRKNDETSYEKMLKLRRDLSRAVTLLEMVKRREKTKREHLHLTIEIVEKRYQAQDFSGALLAEVSALRTSRPAFAPLFTNQFTNQNWTNKTAIKDEILPRKEKRQYKKRKHKSTSSHSSRNVLGASGLEPLGSSDEDDVNSNTMLASPEEPETSDPDEGRYAFRRNKYCSYHMPLTNKLGNWPWFSREENGTSDPRYRFTLTSIRHPKPRCIGFARRRLGRGGRVILDRMRTPYDDVWRELDYTIIETPSLRERLAFEKAVATQQREQEQQQQQQQLLEPSIISSSDMMDMEMCSVDTMTMKSSTLDLNKTIVNPLNSSVNPALRNLYSEHNYNSTARLRSDLLTIDYPTTVTVKTELTTDTMINHNSDHHDVKDIVQQIKEEPASNSNSNSNSNSWTIGGVDASFSSDFVVKQEPCEIVSQSLSERRTSDDARVNNLCSDAIQFDKTSVHDDVDSMLDVLCEIKREWLHFRPKTPPVDYESPCYLLPAKEEIFNPTEFTPITVEIENLSSTPPSALLCDTSTTFTSEFTLNDIYTDLRLDYQILQQQQQQDNSMLAGGGPEDCVDDDLGYLGYVNNDVRPAVVSIDTISDNCLYNSTNNSSASTSTTTTTSDGFSFGCSRVIVKSNSDLKCERTSVGVHSSTTTSDISMDNKTIQQSSTYFASSSSNTNNVAASSTTVSTIPIRRNIQLISNNNSSPQQLVTTSRSSGLPQATLHRTQSILSSTLTSPNKYSGPAILNNATSSSNTATQMPKLVFDHHRVTGASLTSIIGHAGGGGASNIGRTSQQDHPHSNGPVTTNLESSMLRRTNCKPSTATDEIIGDGARVGVHRLQNNTSVNSQMRRALLSSQTIHTLNSNSANLMDPSSLASPLPPNELISSDNSGNVKIKSSLHHIKNNSNSTMSDNNVTTVVTQSNVSTTTAATPGQGGAGSQQPSQSTTGGPTTNNKQQQIVRKNNTLAMEVT